MKTYAASNTNGIRKPLPLLTSLKSERVKPEPFTTSKSATQASESKQVTLNNTWGAMTRNVIEATEDEALRNDDGMVVQRKMILGDVRDRYEQEADRLASQVVNRINALKLGIKPQASQTHTKGNTPSIQLQALRPTLQLKGKTIGNTVPPAVESAITHAKENGQPLELGLQQQIGQAMGADLSGVRVHTDIQADRLNRSLSARAFTTGQDIFFKRGEYQPESSRGRMLIAHELTHTVQQNRGNLQSQILQRNGDQAEPDVKPITTEEKIDWENITSDINRVIAQYGPEQFMVKMFVETGWGWDQLIKKVYKKGQGLDWGRPGEGLNLIHERRQQIVDQAIASVRANIPALNDLEYGKDGSTEPTSDIDCALSGSGTDLAPQFLNEWYQQNTAEGKAGAALAYLYDVNFYPASFVPDREENITVKNRPFLRDTKGDIWRDNPNFKDDPGVNESQLVSAWAHFRLDVSDFQWNMMKFGKIPELQKELKYWQPWKAIGMPKVKKTWRLYEAVEHMSQERKDMIERSAKDKNENKRLHEETQKFADLSSRVLPYRQTYQNNPENLNAYRDYIQSLEYANLYANEAMYTRGAVAQVIGNMQRMHKWNDEISADHPLHKELGSLDPQQDPQQRLRKARLNEELALKSRGLQLTPAENKASMVEHYGRVIHVMDSYSRNDSNPIDMLVKAGKYIHRFYEAAYNYLKSTSAPDAKSHIAATKRVGDKRQAARSLEGIKKGKKADKETGAFLSLNKDGESLEVRRILEELLAVQLPSDWTAKSISQMILGDMFNYLKK